jgi:predicted GTPase
MTLRSLNASNACIVVVDATKGVTDADLGLFRILRGVSTQRMILFINKIDLVQGTAEDARWVAKQIAASVLMNLEAIRFRSLSAAHNRPTRTTRITPPIAQYPG